MKTLRLTLACSFATLAVIACSKAGQDKAVANPPVAVAPVQDPVPVPPAPAPAPTPTPNPSPNSTETADKMKAYTFEQRDAFKVYVTELTTQADATVAALNQGYNSMLASPERRAAMAALAKSATDFSAQAHALDNISAETWESVKSALVTCWQNYSGALAKAQAIKN